jgi:hypothetical protein
MTDLSAHENEQHNTRVDHAIDKTRKELRFVGAELIVRDEQT